MRGRAGTAFMAAVLVVIGFTAGTAAANSQTTSNAPYTCTTNPNVGNQAVLLTVTGSDTVDPAAPGQAETYRFVVPFSEAKPPVNVTYKGGTTSYRIPAGFTVTSVSTQAPAGGSPISSTAAVQGNSIVVTSTANLPIDGNSHPTPDLIVNGTVQSAAQAWTRSRSRRPTLRVGTRRERCPSTCTRAPSSTTSLRRSASRHPPTAPSSPRTRS